MTLQEIKDAVLAGKKVHWMNELYDVVHAKDQWVTVCNRNGYTIGLTWQDGVTMNGSPEEFYVED